jgi:FixJ family two-component response regulator
MRGRRRNMGDRRVIHLVDDEESIRKAASFALKTRATTS